MIYKELGKTGISVSRLCYGSLTLGPLQANLDIYTGANLIVYAYEKGINFIDTAQSYQTYKYIKRALETIPREKYVIFTKTYAYTKELAEIAFEEALKETGTDYIDGFLLHEQESEHTLRGHYEASEYFMKMKEKGYLKAFGISTHNIAGVEGAVKSGYVDVIHPLYNKASLGIGDGNHDQMYEAIKIAKAKGIGIYSMKPLGGGNLIDSYGEALSFVLDKQHIDSTAIGMQSENEIDANVQMVNAGFVEDDIKEKLKKTNRKLLISDWCIGCGNCVRRCHYGALSIVDKRAVVDYEKCILCSYCAKECSEFCIKVI